MTPTMDPDNGPPPGDPGDLGQYDGNQLATQARDCEETGLETVDFGIYTATLTASSIDTDTNADIDANADAKYC